MKKLNGLTFCLLAVVLVWGCCFGQDDAAGKSDKLLIGSVETAGNRILATSRILARVRSRAGELFDPDVAAEDAKRIAELEGVEMAYYNTAVVDGKIRLTFVVVERRPARKITFAGNKKVKSSVLLKKLPFKRGDYFGKALAAEGQQELLNYYHKKGYALAEITTDDSGIDAGQVTYNIKEGPRVRINKLGFRGNAGIKSSQLKKVVKSQPRKFLVLQNYYKQETAAKDVILLQKAYQKKGYLNAEIKIEPEYSANRSKANLNIVIKEGPVYKVRNIIFAGNEYLADSALQEMLRLQSSSVYNNEVAEADVKKISAAYLEGGFIDAQVNVKRNFVGTDQVDVEINISEGSRFRIGGIDITGNQQTHDKVIRRILDEQGFKPGQWYNASIARGDGSGQLEKDIKGIGLAESATITPTGQMPDSRDAQVSIEEGQTGMLLFGGGVSSTDGLIGQIIFEQRNFDYKDKPESMYELLTGQAYKGAGQKFRIALEPGTRVSSYSVSFTEPYLKDKPVSLDLIASQWERERESFDEERTRGIIGFEKRLADRRTRGLRFRFENVGIEDLESDAPKEIRDEKGDNLLVGARLSAGWNLTDSRFNPTKGTILDIGYEQVAGEYTFGIIDGTYRWFKPIYEDLAERKTVLAYKLRGAAAVGDAPTFEKFYAGGQGSMRGFDYRGVSTRASTGDKDPIGSDWLLLANAEITMPLGSDVISALFFVDSGMIDSGGYRAAVGTGIQIMIPQWFGPVPMRFEIATPFLKDGDDDTEVFSFSVGRLF
ncbi:MAG: outer membrane protein assembly factor BamA [Planctomycetota bacterium]